MERLTQWIDEERAIPRVDLRNCGHEKCTTQLAKYEDTGLTPEEIKGKAEALKIYRCYGLTPDQIEWLKEHDTAKSPDEEYGYFICPSCGEGIYAGNDFESHKFCLNCGQRLKWED